MLPTASAAQLDDCMGGWVDPTNNMLIADRSGDVRYDALYNSSFAYLFLLSLPSAPNFIKVQYSNKLRLSRSLNHCR